MSEKEKQGHLLKEKEIAKKEKTLASRELKLTDIDVLTEKELTITLIDMLFSASLDAEETKANIDKFEKAFRDEVEKAVKERLAGPTPKGGGKVTEITLGSDIAKQRNEIKTPAIDPWK